MLVVLTLILALAPQGTALAHGRCYSGTHFQRVWAGNEWHWYTHVPKPSNVSGSWHSHGPLPNSLWPDSVRSRYVMVYFRWFDNINPYLFYRPSQFQACVF